MIRDFLDHLMWEVRINHAESTHLKGRVSMELAEPLGRYMERYGTTLRAGFCVHAPPGMPQDQIRQAMDIAHRHRAAASQRYIDALETLQPVFKEAFACASRGPIDLVAPADRVLDGSFFRTGPPA